MGELMNQIPAMMAGEELTEALTNLPTYDRNVINKNVVERLMQLEDIYHIYIPSNISVEVYMKLYISIVRGLKNKQTAQAVVMQNRNYNLMKREYSGIITGADSFTILGASGIGKSTAIAKAIELATQGQLIEAGSTTIIPCIQVQCPFDCSVKNMLLNILETIDKTIGSNYYSRAIRSRATVDILISSVSNVLLNRVCVLIIDEIQNVVNHRTGDSLVGALVQLINNSGITVCMVGIEESEQFFRKTDYLARRAVGLRFQRMDYDAAFIDFCRIIYGYQYTKTAEPFTERHSLWLYEHTNGVVALVVALIHDAQEIAILEGSDMLCIAALDAAYKKRYELIKGCKQAKIVQRTAKRKDIAADIKANIETDMKAPTYSTVIKMAKAQDLDLTTAVKAHFKVLEVSLC